MFCYSTLIYVEFGVVLCIFNCFVYSSGDAEDMTSVCVKNVFFIISFIACTIMNVQTDLCYGKWWAGKMRMCL